MRLAPISLSHQALSTSRICLTGDIRPALLTSTSTVPYSFSVVSNKASTCSSIATSVAIGTADPPLVIIFSATLSMPSLSRSASTTLDPSVAKRSAMAWPMPRAEPVTITTLSFSSGTCTIKSSSEQHHSISTLGQSLPDCQTCIEV